MYENARHVDSKSSENVSNAYYRIYLQKEYPSIFIQNDARWILAPIAGANGIKTDSI